MKHVVLAAGRDGLLGEARLFSLSIPLLPKHILLFGTDPSTVLPGTFGAVEHHTGQTTILGSPGSSGLFVVCLALFWWAGWNETCLWPWEMWKRVALYQALHKGKLHGYESAAGKVPVWCRRRHSPRDWDFLVNHCCSERLWSESIRQFPEADGAQTMNWFGEEDWKSGFGLKFGTKVWRTKGSGAWSLHWNKREETWGLWKHYIRIWTQRDEMLSPCQNMHYCYSCAVWLGASQERDSTALGSVHTE